MSKLQLLMEFKFDSPLYHFKADRVRLTDNQGSVLGEFEVQSIEVSSFTGRTKVVV